eukprot:scaffold24723_cov131-Isochrysis_galbana.AAC.6
MSEPDLGDERRTSQAQPPATCARAMGGPEAATICLHDPQSGTEGDQRRPSANQPGRRRHRTASPLSKSPCLLGPVNSDASLILVMLACFVCVAEVLAAPWQETRLVPAPAAWPAGLTT